MRINIDHAKGYATDVFVNKKMAKAEAFFGELRWFMAVKTDRAIEMHGGGQYVPVVILPAGKMHLTVPLANLGIFVTN